MARSWVGLLVIAGLACGVLYVVAREWRAARDYSVQLHPVTAAGTDGVRLPNPRGVPILGSAAQGYPQVRVTVTAVDRGTSAFTLGFCLRSARGGLPLTDGATPIQGAPPPPFDTPSHDAHLVLTPPPRVGGVTEKLPVPLIDLTRAGSRTCHQLGQVIAPGIGNQRAFPLDWYEYGALASLRMPRGLTVRKSRIVPIGMQVFMGQNVLTTSLGAGALPHQLSAHNLGFVIVASTPYDSELFVWIIVFLPLALVVAIIVLTLRGMVRRGEGMVAVAVAPFALLALRDQIIPPDIQTRTLVDYVLLGEEAIAVAFIATLAFWPFVLWHGSPVRDFVSRRWKALPRTPHPSGDLPT